MRIIVRTATEQLADVCDISLAYVPVTQCTQYSYISLRVMYPQSL